MRDPYGTLAGAMNADDFREFGVWYSERHRRQTGRPLAETTLRTRIGHLVSSHVEYLA